MINPKTIATWAILIVFSPLVSCSSSDSTSSGIIKIPFEEQRVRGKTTKLATPLPTESKDSILIVPSTPNPFSPSTTIDFKVANDDTVTVYYHDADGNLICEAFRGYLLTGVYRFEPTELHVNSGVYFVKFHIGTSSSVRKVLILR